MATIIRGTTPTITFTFSDIDVSTITVAIMSIKQSGSIKVEKKLANATVGEDSLSWKLTQEETLSFASNTQGTIACDWKLNDGTRGRSNLLLFDIGEPGVNIVI